MRQADNVISATKLVWTLGQLVGLGYSPPDEQIVKRSSSVCRRCLKIVYVAITVVATGLVVIRTGYAIRMPGDHLVVDSVDLMCLLSISATSLTTIVIQFYRQHDLTTVLKDIHEIDIKLKRFPRWRSYRRIKIISIGLMSLTVFWIAIHAMSHVQTCTAVLCIPTSKCIEVWLTVSTVPFVYTVNYVRFTVHMAVVWQKLCTVNDNIKYISEEDVSGSGSLFKEIEKIRSITVLQGIYLDILRICRRLNEIYDIFLLLFVLTQTISIFASLYNCFFGSIFQNIFVKAQSLDGAKVSLVEFLISVNKLLIVCLICHFTTFQSRYTRKLMYQVPISRYNKTLIKKINHFSMRMVHQEFDITAHGFFNIDCTLLLTVVGSVTVYLVMFIQFDLASGSGKEIVYSNDTNLLNNP